MTFAITLPFPPSKNASHGYGRGRVYRSKQYRDWIKRANAIYLSEDLNKNRKPITGEFMLAITYSERGRQIDIQNIIDVTADWLQEVGVIKNDKTLRSLLLRPSHETDLASNHCRIFVREAV